MNIVLNKLALKDLRDIFRYIYVDKQTVAYEYVDKIRDYIMLLENNPKMGKECRYKNLKSICRVLYFDNYQIIYRIVDDSLIRVLRIINTKQNYKG